MTLSFKEAEKKLLSQSSELKQQKQELEIANANLRLGYAAVFPKASVNWADQKRGDLAWEVVPIFGGVCGNRIS